MALTTVNPKLDVLIFNTGSFEFGWMGGIFQNLRRREMASEVYLKLREQLDQYSFGFPATESGVELKILEKLFTEGEAGMFLLLSPMAEAPEAVAQRTGRDLDEAASLLERMAEKGLIFRLHEDETVKYAAVPFVPGIYEFQLGTLDRELAELFEQYEEEGLQEALAEEATFMRPIPIKRSVDVSYSIATYDDSRELVKKQKLIAVGNCICRVQRGLIDKACDKPLDVCLTFGAFAQHYIDLNMARKIKVEEALEILERSEDAGLVSQPGGNQNPGAICNCCGDCCAVLRALNRDPHPAKRVISNYRATVDQEFCTGCETCLERCQMAAITINDDDVAEINLDRCIGCGLCVTTCPDEALHLELKPEDERREIPENAAQVKKEMAERRGTSFAPFAWAE